MADKQFELSVKISAEEQVSGAAKSAAQGLGTLENAMKQQTAALSVNTSHYSDYEQKLIEARGHAQEMASQQEQLNLAYKDVGKALSFLTTGHVEMEKQSGRLSNAWQSLKTKGAETFKTLKDNWLAFAAGAAAVYGALKVMESYEKETKAFAATFGENTEKIRNAAQGLAEQSIYSQREIENTMTRSYDAMERYGLGGEKYLGLVSRTMDVAAGKGLGYAETMERVTSAMRGETEASEVLGVSLDDNHMKNQALGGSLTKVWEKLTDNEKAFFRYQEYLAQTAKYTGEATDRCDNLSGALNNLKDVMVGYLDGPGVDFIKWTAKVINFLAYVSKNPLKPLVEGLTSIGFAISGDKEEYIKWQKELMNNEAEMARMSRAETSATAENYIEQNEKIIAAAGKRSGAEDKAAKQKEQLTKQQAEIDAEALASFYGYDEDSQRAITQLKIESWEAEERAQQERHAKVLGWIEEEYQAEIKKIEKQKEQTGAFYEFWQATDSALQNNLRDIFINSWQSKLKSGEEMFQAFGNSILTSWSGVLAKMAMEKGLLGLGDFLGVGINLSTGAGLGTLGAAGAAAAGGTVGLALAGGAANKYLFGGGDSRQAAAELLSPFLLPVGGPLAAAAIAQMLPSSWAKGLAGYRNLWQGGETKGAAELGNWQENLKASGLESANAGAGWAFSGDTASGETLADNLKQYGPLFDELIAYTNEWNAELGYTNATAAEMASVVIQAFNESGYSILVATNALKELYLQEILAGKGSYETYLNMRSLNQEAKNYTWLDDLTVSISEYMNSTETLTETQYNKLQEYLALISDARAGSAEALESLQNIFGTQTTEEVLAAKQATLAIANDRLSTWQSITDEIARRELTQYDYERRQAAAQYDELTKLYAEGTEERLIIDKNYAAQKAAIAAEESKARLETAHSKYETQAQLDAITNQINNIGMGGMNYEERMKLLEQLTAKQVELQKTLAVQEGMTQEEYDYKIAASKLYGMGIDPARAKSLYAANYGEAIQSAIQDYLDAGEAYEATQSHTDLLDSADSALATAQAQVASLKDEITALQNTGLIAQQIDIAVNITPNVKAATSEDRAGIAGLVVAAIENNDGYIADALRTFVKDQINAN